MNLYQKYGFKVWLKQLGDAEPGMTTQTVNPTISPIVELSSEALQTVADQSDWLKEYTQNTIFIQDTF